MEKHQGKIAFAGTSNFAAKILEHLIAKNEIPLWVLTRSDSIAGRGNKLRSSPVKKIALKHNLPIYQPEIINTDFIRQIAGPRPEMVIVVAYGKILPDEFLAFPQKGCINIHASLLPRWRGAAPIERAIQAGDSKTGISLFKIVRELDKGPILMQKSCPIEKDDTNGILSAKLWKISCSSIIEFLAAPSKYSPQEQEEEMASYAKKINKEETEINWQERADKIAAKINAFSPRPGAYTWLGSERIKIMRSIAYEVKEKEFAQTTPGYFSWIREDRGKLIVKCGSGSIEILQIQFAGRNPIAPQQIQGKSPLNEKQQFSR